MEVKAPPENRQGKVRDLGSLEHCMVKKLNFNVPELFKKSILAYFLHF